MDNEPYRDLGHHEAAELLAELLRSAGNMVQREFWLPDGRIADLFWVTPEKYLVIAEVKLELKASLLDQAMEKYSRWCHRLWFVVPHLDLPGPYDPRQSAMWRQPRDSLGLMGVHRDSLALYRQPEERAMPGKRYAALHALFCKT